MSIEEYRNRLRAYRERLLAEITTEGPQQVESGGPDSETERERLLSELQNGAASFEVRLAALLRLKALSFSDSEIDVWLPRYRDGLRSAADAPDQRLREAAFEVLISYGDTYAQEQLVNSLTSQSDLIPDDQALRLLSQDPHSSAREVALLFTSPDIDVDTRLEAYRVLAGDPEAANQFAALLRDPTENEAIRTLAATALNSVDRPQFRAIAQELTENLEEGVEGIETTAASDVQKHLDSLLELPE